MFPASTKSGKCVAAFPDVCKTPTGPAPLSPIPYPNVGTSAASKAAASKVKIPPPSKPSPFSRTSGDAAGVMKGMVTGRVMDAVTPAQKNMAIQKLKAHLSNLHNQLSQLDGSDPNKWHELLDDYVVRSAELYKTLHL